MFIAKSMEESLHIDEIEVRSLIPESCGKNSFNSQLYGMQLNSSLEVNGNFNFNSKLESFSPLQLSGERYLQGKLQLTEDSVLTVDPDAFSNYQTSEDVTYSSNSTFEKDSENMYIYKGKTLNQLNYKPLPDLLEEIPIARERLEIQPAND